MTDKLLKAAVRSKFAITSRAQASRQIRRLADKYLQLAAGLDPHSGATPYQVPKMPGVDEDMRGWSFYMLLEHNTIVNRLIADIVESLSKGEMPKVAGKVDPKAGVMPGENPGPEQVEAFRLSVDDYLELLPSLESLKGTATRPHPVFGDFDAHQWHCMFGFHLMIHYKQAAKILKGVTYKPRETAITDLHIDRRPG
ncbi:MAG: DinB family protein [Puniceicoccaceae bacterium]